MKAMDQAQLNALNGELQAEYEANRQKITSLEARQAKLQQVLSRSNFHKALLKERAIPNYAPWLPASN